MDIMRTRAPWAAALVLLVALLGGCVVYPDGAVAPAAGVAVAPYPYYSRPYYYGYPYGYYGYYGYYGHPYGAYRWPGPYRHYRR